MSKIFKFSGNFTQDGEWMRTDPAFVGEIVVDEAGKFCGYCDQIYIDEADDCDNAGLYEANRVRYVCGALAAEGTGHSLMMVKLSNDLWQAPLLYEIHSMSTADCTWSAKDPAGGFVPRGNARVVLEELPYDEAAADRIKMEFSKVDMDLGDNGALISMVGLWQKKSLVIWA